MKENLFFVVGKLNESKILFQGTNESMMAGWQTFLGDNDLTSCILTSSLELYQLESNLETMD